MDNSVYLLSRNMDLIKCFLNCDCMGDIFKLEELSTNIYNFDFNLMRQHNNIILVIDCDDKCNHLSIIKELQKLQRTKNIKLVYACENVNKTITDEINKLTNSIIINRPLDFITFLNWLQIQDKEELQAKRVEREVSKQLKYLEVPISVLGFTYLKEAVLMKSKQSKMKLVEICDKIAREHHTTSSRVERCMRTALKNANTDNFAYLGLSASNVSCKDFIVYLSDYVLNKFKE